MVKKYNKSTLSLPELEDYIRLSTDIVESRQLQAEYLSRKFGVPKPFKRVARPYDKLTVPIPELEEYIKLSTDVAELKRLQAVYLRVSFNVSPEEIAKIVQCSGSWIRQVHHYCRRHGLKALLRKKSGGRFRENLSMEQEAKIIGRFTRDNLEAKELDVKKLHKAVEAELGRSVSLSTTYRMLERHGWKKVIRPTHRKSREIQKSLTA